jgi:hypothetical protein
MQILSLVDFISLVVATKHGSQFPNILKVVDLILSISPSITLAERGISRLRLSKTNRRNRLGQNLLNNLLGIEYLSDSVQTFDPENAFKLFQVKAMRRPGPRGTNVVDRERETNEKEGDSVQEEETVHRNRDN